MLGRDILDEIKRRLQAVHGDRLRGVILYGSEARGDARPESDVDILVLLDGPINYLEDLHKSRAAISPVALRIERRISLRPTDAAAYERAEWPLYQNAHREGIAV